MEGVSEWVPYAGVAVEEGGCRLWMCSSGLSGWGWELGREGWTWLGI